MRTCTSTPSSRGRNTYSLRQSLADMGASQALLSSATSVEEWIFTSDVPPARILQVEHYSNVPPQTQRNLTGDGTLPPQAELAGYQASTPAINTTRVPVFVHRNQRFGFQLPYRLDPIEEQEEGADPDERVVMLDVRDGIGNLNLGAGCSR